ncbi:unnamed protein product [Linum tenue]|uniref:Uncharacterized protein n=1 Tax=Linum tenue TaxID=586396 RepID=A0AAV0JJ48_9ROSI|nr:unnamed protein product [Linum tenue]
MGLAGGLRTLLLVQACTFGPIIFHCYYAHPPFTKDTYTTWSCAAFIEIYIHMSYLAVWIAYKEPSFVHSAIWTFLIFLTGCTAICSYIFIQFLKLSPEESAQDPIYHVLLRHEHRNNEEEKGKKKSASVGVARAGFIVLTCLMVATLLYSLLTAGSPFREEVFLAPWVITTLIDHSYLSVVLLVWIAYKETSWLSVSLWMVLFICLGSLAFGAYMTKQLFQLTSQDPAYLVLLKRNHGRADRVPLLGSGQASSGQGQGN